MKIDRKKVVRSHNIVLTSLGDPLSVGNGNFAFTADVTGLQSIPAEYEKDIPLSTMTHWGLHTEQPGKFRHSDFKPKYYTSNQRNIPMNTQKDGQEECYDWLRENPHRINLGRVFFLLDGLPLKRADITDIHQELDLWEGILHSSFTLAGQKVKVLTTTHGILDSLGVQVTSDLLYDKRLTAALSFPYGSPLKSGASWAVDEKHKSTICESTNTSTQIARILDADTYFCKVSHPSGIMKQTAPHTFSLSGNEDSLSFTVSFAPSPLRLETSFAEVLETGKKEMSSYWSKGGFIDLSHCSDPRASELSRRTILSQYLTKIQCSGDFPPQETGLTVNSWYGKAHLEMHYWHSFHFTVFGRPELLERSMWWYHSILHEAKELAHSQGFLGARWPKMPWYNGKDSPSSIAPLLIWQQPHPINYIYNIYRSYLLQGEGEKALSVLENHTDIIRETADFMASFAYYDPTTKRYILGPGIIPAQENHAPEVTLNPTFELEYWHFGLSKASEILELLGEEVPLQWSEVIANLSELPVLDDVYLAHENCPTTYTEFGVDHPSFLCAFGMLPGAMVDKEIMRNSLNKTIAEWTKERLWGWDFPVMALTAARLGCPELAIDLLLMDSPKNTYRQNGHNQQVLREDLPLYLPGNGAFLLAMAGLCAGFVDAEPGNEFLKSNGWDVRAENISPVL